MTKKHVGKALFYVGAAAAVASLARQFLPAQYAIKIPQQPTGNNYANAAIFAGVAFIGHYLHK